jgi:hypothetical protein
LPQRIKVEAGEYEAKIIDDLCEPSGARPHPPKEVLAKFVQQCGSLDTNLCCVLLEVKLDDEDWKVVVKALVGICALAESGKEGVAEYFRHFRDEFIKEIVTDPESQKSLRLAADKCIKTIKPGGAVTPAAREQSVPTHGQVVQAMRELEELQDGQIPEGRVHSLISRTRYFLNSSRDSSNASTSGV